jgi:DNA polymerase elongation subunit (family B)
MKKVYDLETDSDMDKLKVTGLDVVRSSFPAAFQKFMSEVLDAILNRKSKEVLDEMVVTFREQLNGMDFMVVAKNTSVKQVSKYELPSAALTQFQKNTPAHCKAALVYNRLLHHFGVAHTYAPIRDGDKIKWVYLKDNPLGIDGLAVKTYDDPPEIIEYLRTYLDYNSLFEKELANKLSDFYAALGWGLLPTAINTSLMGFLQFEEI